MSSSPAGTDQGGYVQPVGLGYFYEQLNWSITPNPAAETLYLDFPARGYLDQIVVDTICQGATNPPPTNVVAKWLQIPDTSTNGIDVRVTDQSMLADDFRCTATGPITEVRIWGSWLNDSFLSNACFCLGLWTDLPASATNWSMPKQMLCETCLYPGQYTNFPCTNVYWEQFWDPFNPGSVLMDSQVWEYVFRMPTNSCWWQTNGNTYWLSLRIPPGCFDPYQYQFGWKTCPTNWNDDAVYGYQPGVGWQELRRPAYYTNSLDLAFEIVTGTTPTNNCVTNYTITISNCCTLIANQLDHDGGNTLANIMPSLPCDARFMKWDNSSLNWITTTYSTASGWANGTITLEPGEGAFLCPCCSNGFTVTLTGCPHPDGTNFVNPFGLVSRLTNLPGTYQTITKRAPQDDAMVWKWSCSGYNAYIYFGGAWYDNNTGDQVEPTAGVGEAIWIYPTGGGPPPPAPQIPCPSATNNTAAQKWLQIPDTTTNGIDVRVTDQFMLADDFRCTATGPITEVRIWGSWLNDVMLSNACFCLGLWTDNATNGPGGYSRPSQLLCETCFYPGQYTNFLYTTVYWERFWDPVNPFAVQQDSQVWEYIFRMPANSCWLQTNGNTYWLSVRIPQGCFDQFQYEFGWKTCPTNWNDDAVYGYVPGYSWQELRRPPYYTNSLDLAFQIITETNPCPPGVSMICGTNQVVECGTSWTVAPPIVSSPCCGTNYTVTSTTVTNGPCPQVITYTWQVVDCAGSTAACTHTVTIVDTTPPVLTCATNKTVACGSAWSFDPPTAYDLCCGTNVTISIVSTVTNGCQATRTWLAKDCCTNSINCSQTVSINDTTPPTIICASNIVVLTCSTNIAVPWSITATDNCSSVTVTSSPPLGSLFNRDTTNTVTVTATDACGNSNSCTFQVIVRRPSLSISVRISGGVPMVTITWPDGGILQQTPNVVPTTWTDLPLATSPYTFPPSASRMFYRLRCP